MPIKYDKILGTIREDDELVVPMGEISYFSTTGTSTVIAAQSDGSTNMVKATVTTVLNSDTMFDNGGENNGRLRYIGLKTKMFHVACSLSFSGNAASDTYVLGIAKNGTVQAASKILRKMGAGGDIGATAMHLMVELATNDYLEMYVGNITDEDDFTINTLNLFTMGI